MMTEFEKNYIAARREVIRADFAALNSMQQEAVLCTEGALLILAGAGSGKTTVLINRIANLLRYGRASDSTELPPDADEEQLKILQEGGDAARAIAPLCPVEPWRILAITFTNKAADELKSRLENMLGAEANDIWACTFHSACVRILRRDAERLGYSGSFTIYDTSDSLSLMKRIIKDMDLDDKSFPPKAVLSEISRAKDSRIAASDYLFNARASGDMRRTKIGEVYSEYSRRLFAANAMDFDDLIFNTVLLLEREEDVRRYWQKRFRYVLIDEYQDTSHLQYLLAAHLAGGHGNICVVGDDDQSIYKFRGATIENILSFERQFEGCRTIRLEQNYRSTGHILNAANAVIRNNLDRKGKELWTKKSGGNKLELYMADNEHDEAQYVAYAIMDGRSHGQNFRDFAILYRMNAQASQLEFAFKRSGIPYRVVGGNRFFDHAEIKDILSYLCVIAAPSDDLRLTRIINTPARGIGARSIEAAQQLAAENACSLFDIIDHADSYPELSRPALRMRQFAAMIKQLRAFAENNSPDALYDEVLEKTGYLLALQSSTDPKDTARAENVQELKSSIISYMNETGDMTLDGYLANVALYSDMDSYDAESDCVVLMTMHSAKGLEFPTVFIVGMEESIFPGLRAIGEPEEMEEERRLCYVAITRAMEQLYFVCARQRMLFGRTTANRVSRFIDEIPDADINGKNIPRGYSYGDRSVNFGREEYAPVRKPIYTGSAPSAPKAPAAPVKTDYSAGDRIKHKVFGSGIILSMKPMGGDHFIEIEFDGGIRKKFMLRAAAQYMAKEQTT